MIIKKINLKSTEYDFYNSINISGPDMTLY